jgi:hypothetical protein
MQGSLKYLQNLSLANYKILYNISNILNVLLTSSQVLFEISTALYIRQRAEVITTVCPAAAQPRQFNLVTHLENWSGLALRGLLPFSCARKMSVAELHRQLAETYEMRVMRSPVNRLPNDAARLHMSERV